MNTLGHTSLHLAKEINAYSISTLKSIMWMNLANDMRIMNIYLEGSLFVAFFIYMQINLII